jgi:hypothetical protein
MLLKWEREGKLKVQTMKQKEKMLMKVVSEVRRARSSIVLETLQTARGNKNKNKNKMVAIREVTKARTKNAIFASVSIN